MNTIKSNQNINRKANEFKNKLLIFIIYFVPILTLTDGILSAISVILVTISVIILFFSDDFFLVLPILIFFYSQLVLPGGLVVFRIYSILFLFKVLTSKEIRFEKKLIVPFFLISFYSLLVVSYADFRMAITIIFDILFIIIYISNFLTKKSNIIKFFRFYVFAAVASSVYGLFRSSLQLKSTILLDGNWIIINRFLATFNDPNYLGFFFNIAIFSILSIKIFTNKMVKLCLIIILYSSLLATLSTTGLLCNVVGLLVLSTLKKKGGKYLLVIIFMISFAVYIYNFGLQKQIPIITDFSLKIQSRIMDLSNNNFNGFTSNRSALWREHLGYFWNQPIYNIFFGGNLINSRLLDKSKFIALSHQDFIDMLLCVGILGTFILISFYIKDSVNKLLSYYKHNAEEDLLMVMIKYVWLFYAFGFTMFPSWVFYLFFLI